MGQTPEIVTKTSTPTKPFMMNNSGDHATVIPVLIDSATVDSENTGNTNVLRAGLTLAMIGSGDDAGHWTDYGHATTGGTAYGFLLYSVDVQNSAGTARDTWALAVIGGQPLIDEDLVYGMDSDAKDTDLAGRFLWSSDFEV